MTIGQVYSSHLRVTSVGPQTVHSFTIHQISLDGPLAKCASNLAGLVIGDNNVRARKTMPSFVKGI